MDTRSFIENIRKEINSAVSKAFDKVEELSKVSRMKLRIGSLKSDIKDVKTEIGSYVYDHQADFVDNEFFSEQIKKIQDLEKLISGLEIEIEELKEKGEDEEVTVD